MDQGLLGIAGENGTNAPIAVNTNSIVKANSTNALVVAKPNKLVIFLGLDILYIQFFKYKIW